MCQANVVEKIKTHFVFSEYFFENRAVCEIKCKVTVESGRLHMTTRRMRIARW